VPKKVLVVDDDPLIRKAVRLVVEGEGADVSTADNGAECLLAVGAEAPDLVILDVSMPVMDGLQALRALRENTDTRDLPVIMLTARDDDSDVAQGWVHGVDLYLTKPFETGELRLALRRMLALEETDGETPESPSGPAGR
jgi:DNA-binding response OmpR family regulator